MRARHTRSGEELLNAARSGDSNAYFEVWSRHAVYASGVARNLTRSDYDAEDLVSAVRERIWTALSNGNGPKLAFRAYLSTALRNTAAQNARRRPSTITLDELGELATPAEAGIDQVVDSAVMRTALLSLNERQREAVVLSEMCGASNADMAEHFGTTKNNACQIARRAVASLRYAYIDAHMNIDSDAAPECLDCLSSIRRVVADEATPEESASVDSHIEQCEACAAAYAAATDATRHRALIAPLMLGGGATAEWMRTPSRRVLPRNPKSKGARSVASTVSAAGAAVMSFSVLLGGGSMDGIRPGGAGTAVDPFDPVEEALAGIDILDSPAWVTDVLLPDSGEEETSPEPVASSTTLPDATFTTALGATNEEGSITSRETPPVVAPSADQDLEPIAGDTPPADEPPVEETGLDEPGVSEDPDVPVIIGPGSPGSFARSEVFEGHWNVVTASAPYASGSETSCVAEAEGSATIHVTYPVGDPSATRNILTWTGSGVPDTEIMVNGQPVTASIVDDTGPMMLSAFEMNFWQATAEIPRSVDDTYVVEGLSTEMSATQCAMSAVTANVSLTSLYEHDSNPNRIFTMATGLVSLNTSSPSAYTTPSATGKVVEVYVEVLEADPFGSGESIKLGDTRLDDGSGVWISEPGQQSSTARWVLDEPADPADVTLTSGDDHVLATLVIVAAEV